MKKNYFKNISIDKSTKRKLSSRILLFLPILITLIIFSLNYPYLSNIINHNAKAMDKIEYPTMSIHFIDVGQGNSILVQSNNENMLIDAGENASSIKIINYLKKCDVEKLDYVIATHAHDDHIGGMKKIIDNFDINTFFMPKRTNNTNCYLDMLEALSEKNVLIKAPIQSKTYTLGCGFFTIISPDMDSEDLSINNSSITVKITDVNNSFIIGGDIEKNQEKILVKQEIDLSAKVLLLNHHGSKTSNCLEYLNAVNPKIAIISVGNANQYNLPSKDVLDRLYKLNIPYLSTADCGTIVISSNGDSIEFDYR